MNDSIASPSLLAYLGLGSNQGNRIDIIERAISSIGTIEGVQVRRISSLYESDPYYLTDQNRFVNACIEIECSLGAELLLSAIQKIELKMGRKRSIKNGPRTLDIDILTYGEYIQENESLTLPHPGVLERSFVLVPLVEIAPNLVLPGTKKTVLEKLAHRAYPDESLIRMECHHH